MYHQHGKRWPAKSALFNLPVRFLSQDSHCIVLNEPTRGPPAVCPSALSSPLPRRAKQTCVNGDADALILTAISQPDITFYPSLLEGDLMLSLKSTTSTTPTSFQEEEPSTSGGSVAIVGNTADGVVWNVSAFSTELMDWTVFPSTGLLLPGERYNACDPSCFGLDSSFDFG